MNDYTILFFIDLFFIECFNLFVFVSHFEVYVKTGLKNGTE